MTHSPLLRSDYLRGADVAESNGNTALARELKSLATKAPSAPPVSTDDVDALKRDIAEAEETGRFAEAGVLKSRLLSYLTRLPK